MLSNACVQCNTVIIIIVCNYMYLTQGGVLVGRVQMPVYLLQKIGYAMGGVWAFSWLNNLHPIRSPSLRAKNIAAPLLESNEWNK